jgi:hypothetical protein
MQQWLLLWEGGITHPDPIKIFYKDISAQMKQWRETGAEILLLIDANESMGERPGGLNQMIREIGLTDLIKYKHPAKPGINTYARGTKQIDYILGTARIRDHCSAAGILPFGNGYQSDHQQLFVQINIRHILNTRIHPLESTATRKLQNATPRERQKFIEELHLFYDNQNLFQ